MATAPSWTCPKCKRRFAKRNQAHSCQVVPLATHLAKASPETIASYRAIVEVLKALGPLQVAPTKSGINLLSRTSLGGIQLHQDYLDVGFVLTRRLESPRVRSLLQISPRSFVYKVRVASQDEVDAELAAWLTEAYQVGLMAGRRVR